MSLQTHKEAVPIRKDRDGVFRVGGTRVMLDSVIAAHKDGATPEEIRGRYPSLDLADVYAAISFYLRHRTQVETYLAASRREAEAVRRRNEARFGNSGIREQLLARRRSRGRRA